MIDRTKNKFGFIYKVGGDYAIRFGKALFYLFDGINHIETDVDLNIPSSAKKIKGYCLRIDKAHQEWKIVDTGHKGCKDILRKGSYGEGFEESLKKYKRVFNKK